MCEVFEAPPGARGVRTKSNWTESIGPKITKSNFWAFLFLLIDCIALQGSKLCISLMTLKSLQYKQVLSYIQTHNTICYI